MKPRNRFPLPIAMLTIFVAMGFYALSLLADFIYMGWLVNGIGWLVLTGIFRYRKVSFRKSKHLIKGPVFSWAGSFIPFVGGIIGYGLGLWYIIHHIRKEDTAFNKQQAVAARAESQVEQQRRAQLEYMQYRQAQQEMEEEEYEAGYRRAA